MPDDIRNRLAAAVSDRYRVEEELGGGGMGKVYVAEDLRHGRKVAIKVLAPALSATVATERFLREIDILAGLQHPHILTLIDSGEVDGLPWYVMPFVEGQSLEHRLEREGVGTRTTIPPSVLFYYEDVLGLLLGGGFSYALAHRAIHALGSMPLGFVQELFSPDGGFDPEAAEAEFDELAAELPNLTAMVAAEVHANDDDALGVCDSREEFEFTLDLLLEGLERRLNFDST